MTLTPVFPPLFNGLQIIDDPFIFAQERAKNGCDAGLVCYNLSAHDLQAAIVFAPDVVLGDAMIMQPICGVGFQNALGALAPPEVAVHLTWDGTIKVNGGRCGAVRVVASDTHPKQPPDWLIVGLSLALWPASDDTGDTPDVTALYAEGCADVDAVSLLEAWVRHSLVWLNRWMDDGAKPVHSEWSGLVDGLNSRIVIGDRSGNFVGTDDHFGALLKSGDETHLVPLTALLEKEG